MALSIAIWHFDLQITEIAEYNYPCSNHFAKVRFNEVIGIFYIWRYS